ncbi:MAG: GrpB family protein [Dehalococcoidia bacterium]|nr:GrpB family protein [Dehalococcoidia bacterium]
MESLPHDSEGPVLFNNLYMKFREASGEVALRIDHIGPASVEGLAAKPVVDIQISVIALQPNEPLQREPEGLGYTFRGDNPELTKRYFREAPGAQRTHIHVR